MGGVDRRRGQVEYGRQATYRKWDNKAWVQTASCISTFEFLWAVPMQAFSGCRNSSLSIVNLKSHHP
jgi:hypothetical protein